VVRAAGHKAAAAGLRAAAVRAHKAAAQEAGHRAAAAVDHQVVAAVRELRPSKTAVQILLR